MLESISGVPEPNMGPQEGSGVRFLKFVKKKKSLSLLYVLVISNTIGFEDELFQNTFLVMVTSRKNLLESRSSWSKKKF